MKHYALAAMLAFSLGLRAPRAGAQADFQVIHEFDGVSGAAPYGHLIRVEDRLYGMTAGDTVGNRGMIFSLRPDGTDYTILHHFEGQPNDGAWPHGSLYFRDGVLYGTTWAGGCAGTNCENLDGNGCGTIFSLGTDGSGYQVLWTFACGGGDEAAALPNAHLISDGSRLYGTTQTGGAFDGGTVFSIETSGSGLTILHSFNAFTTAEGKQPSGGLVLDAGKLYGTTAFGGQTDSGTVFSIRTDGSDFTILHDFIGSDGTLSFSSPILAGGRLFGATMHGGDYDQGGIFSLGTDGADYQVLRSFDGVDGASAYEGVILAGDTLFGVTVANGPVDFGVIYSLRPDGSDFQVLHRFSYDDGSWVDGRLLLMGDRFYGLASNGGTSEPSHGVIFSFARPLPDQSVVQSGDYNGDGRSGIAIFRPPTGLWAVRGLGRVYFGSSGDIPVSGDYDGDGYADVSVFRRSEGLWAIKGITRFHLGGSDDLPVPGDYDGDGSCDAATFEQPSGRWTVRGITSVHFGALGDRPAPGDYDGDGRAELAIFRSGDSLWAIRDCTRFHFGSLGDAPVPGVYQWYGSGRKAGPFRSQAAVFRSSSSLWSIRNETRFYIGSADDRSIPADYDGDSVDEPAVFRDSTGLWSVANLTRLYFGGTGDVPATR